jgi:hypothetical protein
MTHRKARKVEEVKEYELFPDRRLQEKIDYLLSPYNKTQNFRR